MVIAKTQDRYLLEETDLSAATTSLEGNAKYHDFSVRAALFDHTVRGALSPPHASRALGSATQGRLSARCEDCARQL